MRVPVGRDQTSIAAQVRDCKREDMAAVTAIYAHHVLNSTASFEEAAPSHAEMTSRFDAVRALGLPYLVAEIAPRCLSDRGQLAIDGKVAGYASATLYRTRSAYRFTLENAIYIDHAMLRRGIGRALLAELLRQCEALGYRQMIAVIGDSGNQASIGLHTALGFTHAGIFRSAGFKFGRWLDSVLMQRYLGEGDRTPPGME